MSSKNLLQETAETEVALEHLRTEMAEILSSDVATILAGNASHAVGVSHPTDLLLDGVDLELSTPGYAAGDPKPDTLNLQFELRWQSKSGRPRTLELTCAKR